MKKASAGKPLKAGKIARVPMVMQMEAVECGAACLDMILGYYGLFIPLSKVRRICGVSRDGSTMKSIYQAAENYGLEVHAYRYGAMLLEKMVTFPCILFWDFEHFVVLDGIKNGKYVLNDPARGIITIKEDEFKKSYSGLCLTFSPSEWFVQGGKPESVLDFTSKRLKDAGAMIALVLLTTLVLTILGVLEPVFPRLFVDYVLTDRVAKPFVQAFFIGFAIFAAVKIIVLWLKNAYLIRMEGRMSVFANTQFMWHILRLPMDFFSQRFPGDIISRQKSNAVITASLIQRFAPLALDFAAMVFYLILMIQYSALLAMISVVSVAINLAASVLISRKRINISRTQMKNSSLLANTGMTGMVMIETIKSSGAENGFFTKWSGVHSACNDDNIRLQEINTYLGQIPELISALTGNLILCFGIAFIIRGEWTMGLISAFTGYLNAFNGPAKEFVNALQSFQEMRTNVERVEDVMKYPTDIPSEMETVDKDTIYEKLSGDIEFKNVTFGYNPLQEPLIDDFNLKIKKKSVVAFVGASGSGKTTLANMITGLNKPWYGEILIDGKPVSKIKRSIFTASVSSVDQKIALFGDTISNNISMWDHTISYESVIDAAQDAAIYDNIAVRENGFSTRMLEGGHNFSGGECQRIEIARALASDPTVLVLDEATSALDAETEYKVINAVRERGITTVMISHRLSMVRDCDEIVVLRDGGILDHGRHEELMERCEYYAGMISND